MAQSQNGGLLDNRYVAEVLGTFALVFAGCGAVVVDQMYGGALGHIGINMVFGLVVMAVIYSIGNVSGAHINPAVTIAFAAAGRFEWRTVAPYIGCQLVGAGAAGMLLLLLFPGHETYGATHPAGSIAQAFGFEVVISFLLMFVVFNVSTGHMEKGIMAGVAVGGTVAFLALMGGPVTGASMNPARSFGPALASGDFSVMWLYISAPILGMLLAYPVCRVVQGDHWDGPIDE